MNTLTREQIEKIYEDARDYWLNQSEARGEMRELGIPPDADAVVSCDMRTLRALCDMALRSEPAQPVASKRDTDWILAMGAALGMDSGFSIPIVPEVEPFRQLFAALRASPPPAQQPAPEVAELVRLADCCNRQDVNDADDTIKLLQACASAMRQAAAALSARRVSAEALEWANEILANSADYGAASIECAMELKRLAGGEHG